MKILLFNEKAGGTGGGRNQYVADVALRLREAGQQVGLVHARDSGARFKGTGYVFDSLGYAAGTDQGIAARLDAILSDFRPDVIQLHGMENIDLQPQLLAAAPVVRFVHNHTFYCSGGAMTHGLPRRICTRKHGSACLGCHYINRCGSLNPIENFTTFRKVGRLLDSLHSLDGIQVASEVILENLVNNGIPREAVTFLPLYAPEPVAVRRSNLKPARRMLLHPGGLVPNKGVWMLLRIINKLPDDVELVFVGDGPDRSRVDSFVRSRGLKERVRVMGALAGRELSELFHQSVIVLFPSRWNEPVGLCGIQAMAHSKPVIAYDAGGVRSWLIDRGNGRIVRFNREKEFLTTLKKLLQRPQHALDMGRSGRRMWEQTFRPALHIENLLEYYQTVIDRRKMA